MAALPAHIKLEKTQPRAQTPDAKLSEARQRFPINVLSNVAWLVLNVITGIWYIPYLIGRLGIAAYGLVPLASSVT